MSSDPPDVAPGVAAPGSCPTLILSIADDELRRWAILKVAAEWHGPLHVVDEPSDLFSGHYGRGFVLVICAARLGAVLREHPRRWPYFARQGSIVLLASADSLDQAASCLSAVDALLVAGRHDDRALSIIQAAKKGMLALPSEMLDRMLRKRGTRRSRSPKDKEPPTSGDDDDGDGDDDVAAHAPNNFRHGKAAGHPLG